MSERKEPKAKNRQASSGLNTWKSVIPLPNVEQAGSGVQPWVCLSVSSRKPPDPLGSIAVCQCLRCLTVIEGGLRKRAITKTYPLQHVADSRRHWADGLNGNDYHIRRAGDWGGQEDGLGAINIKSAKPKTSSLRIAENVCQRMPIGL